MGDESVVLYQIEAIRTSDGKTADICRRFKEFFDLHEDISSAYVGNHLANSLPKLPRRGIKLFSDHLDPLFVEKRRNLLQTYLRALMKVPRVTINPEFLNFIGMINNSGGLSSPTAADDEYSKLEGRLRDESLNIGDFIEFSEVFPEGPLGMTLKNQKTKFGKAVVDGFNRLENGELLPAEKVRRGLRVVVSSSSP